MSADIAQKVKDIVVEHLSVDASKVVDGANFVDDLNADSLDQVELVMKFEDGFGIEIPEEDAEKITTVQAAIDYIKGRVAA